MVFLLKTYHNEEFMMAMTISKIITKKKKLEKKDTYWSRRSICIEQDILGIFCLNRVENSFLLT